MEVQAVNPTFSQAPVPGWQAGSEPSRQQGAWPLTSALQYLSAPLLSVAISAVQILLPELLAVKCADIATTMPTSLFEYSPWALLA